MLITRMKYRLRIHTVILYMLSSALYTYRFRIYVYTRYQVQNLDDRPAAICGLRVACDAVRVSILVDEIYSSKNDTHALMHTRVNVA